MPANNKKQVEKNVLTEEEKSKMRKNQLMI